MRQSLILSRLFPSRARRELLRELFVKKSTGNASELGRRCRVSPRMARVILSELAEADLVEAEGVGASVVFRPAATSVAVALGTLLSRAEASEPKPNDSSTDSTLAWFGAPLLRAEPKRLEPLEPALANAAKQARRDPTLFKTLPVVLAKNCDSVDWSLLRDCALHADSKSEVGFLVELTGELSGNRSLARHARDFRDQRRVRMEYFFPVQSEFDEALAKKRTPAVARRWKFWMNMDLNSLKSTLERFEKVPS